MPASTPAATSAPGSVPRFVRARAGLLQVSAGALLWGTTGVAVRIIRDRSGLPAVTIGWYRVLVSAMIVCLVVGVVSRLGGGPGGGLRGASGRPIAAFRRHPVALLVCGAGFGGYQALYFVGVQDVGVSVSTLVSLGVAPIALTAGVSIARRRAPSRGSLAVLACAIAGLALVSLRPGSGAAAPHPTIGVLASLASGLGYAATTAVSRRMPAEDPLLLTGITSGVGALVLLPFALAAGIAPPHDGVAAGWVGYIGVVPTVLAYWLFYRGLRSTASEVAGVLTLLEPLAATGLAVLVLHESLSRWALVGGALMLLAVASFYARPRSELSVVDARLPP